MVTPGVDPVIERRNRIARAVSLAKRVGYSLMLIAIAAFALAAITGFPAWAVTVTVVALIGTCVVLPVPIVLGYGLRAAEREDRQRAHGPGPGAKPEPEPEQR